MRWLRRLLGRLPELNAEQVLTLSAYHSQTTNADSLSISELRFVVADVETTGLNPFADHLISIGAVELDNRTIRLSSAFEVVLRQTHASSHANILIHGIDGTTQLAGLEPAAAILGFLDYAKKAPIVGFHAGFDRMIIDRASKKALGCALSSIWLDLAYLTPALFNEPGETVPEQGLDEWLRRFGIEHDARHNALADAVATAQLLQVVLAQAIATGTATLADLMRLEQNQRWLRQI